MKKIAFTLIALFFFNVVQNFAQSSNEKMPIDCNGLIVFNYTRDINNPFYVHFRRILIEKMQCKGGLIDHTKNSTINSLNTRYGINEVVEKMQDTFPGMKKVLFLEYNIVGLGKVDVYGTILTNEGIIISNYSQQFEIEKIDETTENEKEPIRKFALHIMGEKVDESENTFKDINKFNILIANFNIVEDCPQNRASPEKIIFDRLKQNFGNDIIEVLIDNNSVSVNSDEQAKIRRIKKDADLIIWSGKYEKKCNGGEKANYNYSLKKKDDIEYVTESGYSNFENTMYLNDVWLSDTIGRIIYWTLSIEAINSGESERAIKHLLSLKDDNMQTDKEKSEKYFLLGKASFSSHMNKQEFDKCKNYFNKSIKLKNSSKTQKYWLELLMLLKNNPTILKEVNDEYETQSNHLLSRDDLTFPVTEEDYIFCITLAKRMKKNDNSVEKIIESAPKDSYKILKSLVEYY
ncbi:MAG: hypothetical protein KDD24_10360, partial [Flavobacteriales bacterium]|nr:hypothetical protein [Flavobacteriales bacterium]